MRVSELKPLQGRRDDMSEQYLIIYIWMAVVYGFSLVEHTSFNDIVASLFVGMLWPVTLPAAILRRLKLK